MTWKIKNWGKWQSYRKDRGQPPWIKLHRCLMRNAEWVSLNDTQRGQLVSLWLLAADKDGELPFDAKTIKKLCFIESKLDMQVFVNNGFMVVCKPDDANLTPPRQPDDAQEKRREEKNRIETEKKEKDNLELFESCWKLFGSYGTKKIAVEYWKLLNQEDRQSINERIPIYLEHLERTGVQKKMFQGWINPKNRIWETTYEQSAGNRRNGLSENTTAGANPTTDWSKVGGTEYVPQV